MRLNLSMCRHVSLLRALVDHGVSEDEARRMIETAGLLEFRISSGGRTFMVCRKRGGHADVHEVGDGTDDV